MSAQPPEIGTDLREYLRSFRADTLQILIYLCLPILAGWFFLVLSQADLQGGLAVIAQTFLPLLWFGLTIASAWAYLKSGHYERSRLLFYLAVLGTPLISILLNPSSKQFMSFMLLFGVMIAGVLSGPLAPFRVAGIMVGMFVALGLVSLFGWFSPATFNSFGEFVRFSIGPTFLLGLTATGSWLATRDLVSTVQWAMESHRLAERRAERLSVSEAKVARTLVELEGTYESQTRLNIQLQQLNRELETARRAADEANTLKTRFLANMSHELRTPLNAIINFTQFMAKPRYGDLTQRQLELQERVIFNSEHLLGLINDILDLSKIEAGRMELHLETFDLKPIITGVMATAVGLTKSKGVELETDVDDDLPLVRGDNVRVRQILLNLLSNAAKFTDEGVLTVRAFEKEGMVHIAVKDTGSGIPAAELPLVFQEFHQVEQAASSKRQQGTGLGLPISSRLVELQGGTMWAESELGLGSTFTFTLPIGEPDADEPPEVIIFDPESESLA